MNNDEFMHLLRQVREDLERLSAGDLVKQHIIGPFEARAQFRLEEAHKHIVFVYHYAQHILPDEAMMERARQLVRQEGLDNAVPEAGEERDT